MASLKSLQRWLQYPTQRFLMELEDRGLRPRVTSTRRSGALQRRLYRRYLAGRSAFPAAPPGQSAHQRGLAFDLVTEGGRGFLGLRGLNDEAGRLWNSWGGRWAGSVDRVHFGV